jgi:hypothetical protein
MTAYNVAVIRGVISSSLISLSVGSLLTMDCKKILDSVHIVATLFVMISILVNGYNHRSFTVTVTASVGAVVVEVRCRHVECALGKNCVWY